METVTAWLNHDDQVAANEARMSELGYGYEESRLTADELAGADPKRVKQYQIGIITGGELDYLTRNGGRWPWESN